MAKRIYVGNLSYNSTEDDVRSLFEQVGPVTQVDIPMDRMTGRPRGFGFVEMADADAAKAIEKLNGVDLGGRSLRINEAQARTGGGSGGGGAPRGPRGF